MARPPVDRAHPHRHADDRLHPVLGAPGIDLADRCIVAAGATVTGKLDEDSKLYAGTPARAIHDLDPDAAFVQRTAEQLL